MTQTPKPVARRPAAAITDGAAKSRVHDQQITTLKTKDAKRSKDIATANATIATQATTITAHAATITSLQSQVTTLQGQMQTVLNDLAALPLGFLNNLSMLPHQTTSNATSFSNSNFTGLANAVNTLQLNLQNNGYEH